MACKKNFFHIFAVMKTIEITNLDCSELDVYARLTESQLRNKIEPEKGIFIAESLKVVRVALENGFMPLSFLAEKKFVESQIVPLMENYRTVADNIPVFTAEREVLKQITGYELSRGIICAMRRPLPPNPEKICMGKKIIGVLDGVVNSTNTGAIFRAATALGVEALLLTTTCCDPLNRRSVRVSMGTVLQMPWTYLPCNDKNEPYTEWLHQQGFTTIALALSDKAICIDDPKLTAPERKAIILGTEGDGLGANIIDNSDFVAMIPMQNGVDSLNVAAAASLAFWQLRNNK